MSRSQDDNTLLPLVELVEQIPGGVPYATVWRWTQHGVKGIRLESRRIGGRVHSSIGAVRRFFDALDTESGSQPLTI